jgi:hypothetical protein
VDGDGNEDEPEDNEGRTIYPYERLTTTSEDPVPGIDVTKREVSDWIAGFQCTGCSYQLIMKCAVTI